MRYLPINLVVTGKQVVIVGGGAVAARKCGPLLAAGALVTVIAPTLDPSLQELSAANRVRHLARPYRAGDLAGAYLVYAATDQPSVNREVATEAAILGILAEVASAPGLGDFTTPAEIRRGDLLITVATGGLAPTLAASLRTRIAETFGPEYGRTATLLGLVREKLLTEQPNRTYNKQILSELAERLPPLVKAEACADIDRLLRQLCGPGFTMARLTRDAEDTP